MTVCVYGRARATATSGGCSKIEIPECVGGRWSSDDLACLRASPPAALSVEFVCVGALADSECVCASMCASVWVVKCAYFDTYCGIA
jgi:hypothetical protein